MFNPFSQYGVMRSSGISPLGSALFVVFCIIIQPYMWYINWKYDRLPEDQKGFGKFKDRKQFRLDKEN